MLIRQSREKISREHQECAYEIDHIKDGHSYAAVECAFAKYRACLDLRSMHSACIDIIYYLLVIASTQNNSDYARNRK